METGGPSGRKLPELPCMFVRLTGTGVGFLGRKHEEQTEHKLKPVISAFRRLK